MFILAKRGDVPAHFAHAHHIGLYSLLSRGMSYAQARGFCSCPLTECGRIDNYHPGMYTPIAFVDLCKRGYILKTQRKDLSVFSSCKCGLCIKEPIRVLLVVTKAGSLAAGVEVLSELDGISPLLLIEKTPLKGFLWWKICFRFTSCQEFPKSLVSHRVRTRV